MAMRCVHVVALGFGLALSGCAAGGGGPGQMTWVRTDGRPIDRDFQQAADDCRKTASRAGGGAPKSQRDELMMATMTSCMQLRGYVWRCESPLGGLGTCNEGGGESAAGDKRPRSAKF
jgi:hypothetical protein